MSLLVRLSRRFVGPLRRPIQVNVTNTFCTTTTSSSDSPSPKRVTMDDVNELFAEARMSLQDALESKGTVYFEDDFEDAKKITQETLNAFKSLCDSTEGKERQSIIEANRPKMAQLEQEFKNLEDELIHDD